jgi:alpha/beta superfamily hydrolase
MDFRPLAAIDGTPLAYEWHPSAAPQAVAVLAHPHTDFGGNMHHPLIAELARSLPDHGISAIRFNFRGAPGSGGHCTDGVTEPEDLAAAVALATDRATDHEALLPLPVFVVGYSFGADVALARHEDPRVSAFVLIAPPLVRRPEGEPAISRPTLVIRPEHDQMRPEVELDGADFVMVAGCDHFLAGHISSIVESTTEYLVDQLQLAQ